MKDGFIDYLHSFRGFAIFCVVAVHAVVMPIVARYDFDTPAQTDLLFIINETLFHASTIYFALISGLLYSAVLHERGFKKFFKSKFLYVLLPYLFYTLLLSIGKPPEGPDEQGGFHPSIWSYLETVGKNLIFGKGMAHFWYIPVLFILYFFTPLFSWILTRNGFLKWLIVPFILAPLVISRQPIAYDYSFFWQDSVFFLGVYAIGIAVGFRLEEVMNWVDRNFTFFIAGSIITTGTLGYLYWSGIEHIGFTSIRESIHYLNKLLIAGLVLSMLRRKQNQPKVLTRLATDAFGIYFVHFGFIFLGMAPFIPLLQNEGFYPWSVLLSLPVILAVSLFGSIGFLWIFKKIIGKRSRMIFGA